MDENAKKVAAFSAAGIMLASSGGVVTLTSNGPVASGTLSTSVGSVFAGTIEAALNGALLVGRKRRQDAAAPPSLVAVQTDAQTIVNRKGQAIDVDNLTIGTDVIVSGTKMESGIIQATKLIIRS